MFTFYSLKKSRVNVKKKGFDVSINVTDLTVKRMYISVTESTKRVITSFF